MNILALFLPVNTFVFDVDGVMTDGSLLILENGEYSRRMHIRDGYALQMALREGYRVAVISGGNSKPVIRRLKALGVNDIFMGVTDKRAVLVEYIEENGVQPGKILYMGDDIPDYGALQMVGLPAFPADAAPEI
jgi:3-deoxy-D-manno-octulosonate 8-phosphate phosphatase (KDO 8-P phosphatase)